MTVTTDQWAVIIGKLLATGDPRYRISGMYLEFCNLDTPGIAAPIPSLDVPHDRQYYAQLSAPYDYLRVPLTSAELISQDSERHPDGDTLVLLARSQGLQGVNGLPFSESSNSVIIGGALIALIDERNASQDLVAQAFYYDEAEQQPKLDRSQNAVEWTIPLLD